MRGISAWLVTQLMVAGSALAGPQAAVDYLASKQIPPPRTDHLVVCHDFGCASQTVVRLDARDIADVRALFAKRKTAAEERSAIARAVALIERRVGPVTGTSRDRGGLDPLMPEPGQLDCIDESTNTTGYLVLLGELGLLRFHQPAEPSSRGFLFDLRYPHQTAVMTDRITGAPWVVDSWPRPNGALPDIMRLDAWQNAERRMPW